jgi:hypothetical protein
LPLKLVSLVYAASLAEDRLLTNTRCIWRLREVNKADLVAKLVPGQALFRQPHRHPSARRCLVSMTYVPSPPASIPVKLAYQSSA